MAMGEEKRMKGCGGEMLPVLRSLSDFTTDKDPGSPRNYFGLQKRHYR